MCGQATRSAAGVEEKFVGGIEKEGRVVLWTNSATRCGIIGAGVARCYAVQTFRPIKGHFEP